MNSRRKHLCWSVAMIAAVALPLAIASVSAQSASQPKASPAAKPLKGGPHANWTGVWVIAGSFLDTQDGTSVSAPTGRPEDAGIADMRLKGAKLKPEPLKRMMKYIDAMNEGKPIGYKQCRGMGMPQFWGSPFAWEIIQSADQINMALELGGVRRIYLDGRKHPSLDDVDPLVFGHSIGHWEGDDLVVDTVNISTDVDMVGPETNHTEKSHITERFHPVASDKIDVEVTVTNPDVLEEPWTFVRHIKRKPDMEIVDYDCLGNNRNPVGPDGREQAILPPQK